MSIIVNTLESHFIAIAQALHTTGFFKTSEDWNEEDHTKVFDLFTEAGVRIGGCNVDNMDHSSDSLLIIVHFVENSIRFKININTGKVTQELIE